MHILSLNITKFHHVGHVMLLTPSCHLDTCCQTRGPCCQTRGPSCHLDTCCQTRGPSCHLDTCCRFKSDQYDQNALQMWIINGLISNWTVYKLIFTQYSPNKFVKNSIAYMLCLCVQFVYVLFVSLVFDLMVWLWCCIANKSRNSYTRQVSRNLLLVCLYGKISVK